MARLNFFQVWRSSTLSLPPSILRELNATDIQTLDLLIDLMRIQRKKSPNYAAYCYPGEEWIGAKVNRSRQWISETVQKLHHLGLIHITPRRKVHRRWQTNLYRLGQTILQLLGSLSDVINSFFHRVNSTRHIVRRDINISYLNGKKDLSNDTFKKRLEEIKAKYGL